MSDVLDYKVTKRHYPRTNNEEVLEFLFEKDPNLFLRKNKIIIKGSVEINKNFVVENGWVAKLFSMITVEVESQAVTLNRNRGEYFLTDYLQKVANFNRGYIDTFFTGEGYYDGYNYGHDDLSKSNAAVLRRRAVQKTKGDNYVYDFAFVPNIGFLAGADPLLKDTQLKLSFDRASPKVALVKLADAETDYLEIKDCMAITEYISSPALRAHFETIDREPIVYQHEDVSIIVKSVPVLENTIRLDNIHGGNIPNYLFAGLIPTSALNGDFSESSTGFQNYGIEEINITLNGNSVNGYPINVTDGSETWPLLKFNDTTGRMYNLNCGEGLSPVKFKSNFLWSHHFEAETTAQGWIGINFKLKEPLPDSYSMVIWLVNPTSVQIDKFNKVEKMHE